MEKSKGKIKENERTRRGKANGFTLSFYIDCVLAKKKLLEGRDLSGGNVFKHLAWLIFEFFDMSALLLRDDEYELLADPFIFCWLITVML